MLMGSLVCLAAFACGPDVATMKKDAVKQYAKVGSQMYADTLSSAKAMQTSINAFVADPSEANLTAAKESWKAARIVYEKTEGLRFYGGPIDNGEGGAPEANINPWPLDENYIDYVDGAPTAGIVNDTTITLDKATLIADNGSTGEANLTLGWHAIEFLLWGQDLTAPSEKKPGQRAFTDYTTAANADRRKQYLTLTTEILIDDLTTVNTAWNLDDSSTYGAKFVAAADTNADAQLTLMLKGLGNFLSGELNRERINNGLATGDQEEEHSCFSDTTVPIDLNNSIYGVRSLLTGSYGSLTGESIQSAIDAKDAATGARLKTDLDAAVAAVDAIPAPFDADIAQGEGGADWAKIKTLVDANNKLSLTLADVASKLGVSLDFDYCPDGVTTCKP